MAAGRFREPSGPSAPLSLGPCEAKAVEHGQPATDLYEQPSARGCMHLSPETPNTQLWLLLLRDRSYFLFFHSIWLARRVKVERVERKQPLAR